MDDALAARIAALETRIAALEGAAAETEAAKDDEKEENVLDRGGGSGTGMVGAWQSGGDMCTNFAVSIGIGKPGNLIKLYTYDYEGADL